MRSQDDVRGSKSARTEFTRRGIDLTLADVQVRHGVVIVRGTLQRMKSFAIPDLKAEVMNIARILKTKAEIRDVIVDATFRST